MSRKITKKETEKLFLFCEKHYVNHYDLQIELVDHLASAIEEQWETDSELTFDEALKNSFGKFGIHGFSKIKVQKEKELRRKYNRLLWKFFLEFYKLPKVIMTFAFTLGLFLLLQIVENNIWVILSYFALLVIIGIAYFFIIRPKYKVNVVAWKSFMILDYLKQVQGMISTFIYIPIAGFNFYNAFGADNIQNSWILFAISFLIVAFSILFHCQYYFIPKKIKEHFIEQFGEFAK